MAAEALEQSVLESKDKDQLLAIAKALGLKASTRTKKSDIIDQILETTGSSSRAATATRAAAVAAVNGNGTNGDGAVAVLEIDDARRAGDDRRASTRRPRRAGREPRSPTRPCSAPTASRWPSGSSRSPDDGDGDGRRRRRHGRRQRRARQRADGSGQRRERAGRAPAAIVASRPAGQQGGGGQPAAAARAAEDGESRNRRRRRRRKGGGRGVDGPQGDDAGASTWSTCAARQPAAPVGRSELVDVSGYLDMRDEGYGFLRVKGYLPSRDDAYIPVKLARQYGLRKGDHVTGVSRPAGRNEKNPALLEIQHASTAAIPRRPSAGPGSRTSRRCSPTSGCASRIRPTRRT